VRIHIWNPLSFLIGLKIMAVAKKASTAKAKAAPKKAAAKKTSTKKSVKSSDLVIVVPQGGQVIRTFNLTPALPVDGQAQNWLMADPAKPTTDIDSIRVSFSVQSSELEQEFERAIIEINMLQNPNNNGVCRFMGTGVGPEYSDVHHDVEVEISNQGLTLTAQIQVIGDYQEEIKFGYVAAFTEANSGEITIYESQDPGINPGRP
jgi:hypothetical protein